MQVDAYVKQDDGTRGWVSGAAANSPSLPDGVAPGDIGGLRFSYTGDIVTGAAASVGFDVAQRATQRDTGDDLLAEPHHVDNTAGAEATKEGQEPARDSAGASYRGGHPGAPAARSRTDAAASQERLIPTG